MWEARRRSKAGVSGSESREGESGECRKGNNPSSTPFLFVYGTLMKGLGEGWLAKLGAELVGQGSIGGRLYDLGDYPGATPDGNESRHRVKGELYRLADPELAMRVLDQYEEFLPSRPEQSLFVRTLVLVTLANGRKEDAWAYFYNGTIDETKLIPSGDYQISLR
jgi:gamma-glutamylcyclotransferase (GGCT)/AIG2-like uncharacterized protein YtfP